MKNIKNQKTFKNFPETYRAYQHFKNIKLLSLSTERKELYDKLCDNLSRTPDKEDRQAFVKAYNFKVNLIDNAIKEIEDD
jgi:uncharacterized UBP type Zn finger protein